MRASPCGFVTTSISITSNAGQPLRIRYDKLQDVHYVFRLNGERVAPVQDENIFTVPGVGPGDVVTVIYEEEGTDIGEVRRPFGEGAEAKLYNLAGQEIADTKAPRIVVRKGKKTLY